MQDANMAPWLGHAAPVCDVLDSPPLPGSGFADVTYVDDCAMLLHAPDNRQVLDLAQTVVESFAAASAKRGLEVNFSPGKTALMLNLVGKETKAIRHQLFQAHNCLSWESNNGSYQVHVCAEYKHLGTWIQLKHRHAKELAARTGAAKQQWGQLCRAFFAKPLAPHTKAPVFQSLVVSKFVFQAHVWCGLPAKEFHDWTNGLKGPAGVMLKGVLAETTKYRHTTANMLAHSGIVPILDQVHANRLRFFKRLLGYSPRITWQLLQADTSPLGWLHHLSESFAWMRIHSPASAKLPPADALQDWLTLVRLDDRWKGRIRKTLRLALAQHQALAEHAVWCHNIEATLAQAGMQLPVAKEVEPFEERWKCELCDKVFRSTRALAMHASRDHGYRKKARFFAIGATCHACCTHFHSRRRLMIHYEKANACYDRVQQCWPPLEMEVVVGLDSADKALEIDLRQQGWWASKAFSPAYKVAGPTLPPLNHPAANDMRCKALARQTHEPEEAELPFQQLQGHAVQQSHAHHTGVWLFDDDLPDYIEQSSGGPDAGHGAFSAAGLVVDAARLHVKALVAVHFFSGYRRHGDIHQILEHHILGQGLQIFVVSVDLCMQRERADLADRKALSWWRSRIHSGLVVAGGGGPPCETFTAARQLDGEGPKPLRSATHPHGLPGLNHKEWRQVGIGDKLMHFLVDILVHLALAGGCGFLEHPQHPKWANPETTTSIWKLRPLKLLARLQCTTVVSFDQCTCGAVARKPTTLILVRMADVRAQLLAQGNAGRCNHPPGAHVILRGRQEDGQFQTAKAKIYPARLNAILAEGLFHGAQRLSHPNVSQTMPVDFHPYLVQEFHDECIVQPDFHG